MHGKSCSPQRIKFITGFCLYYRHWEKNRKNGGNVKNVQGIHVALCKLVSRHNCGRNTLRNLNKHGLGVNLAELSNRETFLPPNHHPSLPHHEKKQENGRGGGMSHQCGKPQLALIMSKTYLLWTLLWL